MENKQITNGVMNTQEIRESQSYYGIRKAVEEGSWTSQAAKKGQRAKSVTG